MYRISYDFHLHSCLSPCGDDDMTPGNIVGMASLIGLEAIALTDHNSCKNCPAFMEFAEEMGLIAIPGMELTTMEEVHVLCLFSTLEQAMNFDAYVEQHIMPIPNRPEFFGNQIIVDNSDEACGTVDTLLISATDISFNDVYDLVKEYGGIMVPAHLDKSSTSLLSNLGFIPPESQFTSAEVKDIASIEPLKKQHPYLEDCHFLCSSDAHSLSSIHEPIHILHVEEKTVEGILNSIIKKHNL